jgi:hypothetical protein
MANVITTLSATPARVTIGQPCQLTLTIANLGSTAVSITSARHWISLSGGVYDGSLPKNVAGSVEFIADPFPLGINPFNQITAQPQAGVPGISGGTVYPAIGNSIAANSVSNWGFWWVYWPANFKPDTYVSLTYWINAIYYLSDGTYTQPVTPCQVTVAAAPAVAGTTNAAANSFNIFQQSPTYATSSPQFGGLSMDLSGPGNSFLTPGW